MKLLLLIIIVIIIIIICLSFQLPYSKKDTKHTKHTKDTKHTNNHSVPCKDNLTDKEYLEHMIPHHEVAVFMSEQLLNKTQNPIILNILRNIIRIQTYEIAMMKDAMTNKNTL